LRVAAVVGLNESNLQTQIIDREPRLCLRTLEKGSKERLLPVPREADLLLHIVDISHPDFEEQIQVVNKTLADLGCADKPSMIVFNKIDNYHWVEKEEDDLTPATKENITLDELKRTWMAKEHDNCLFISAKKKENIDEFREVLYKKVRELHVQKYPYNDFLYNIEE